MALHGSRLNSRALYLTMALALVLAVSSGQPQQVASRHLLQKQGDSPAHPQLLEALTAAKNVSFLSNFASTFLNRAEDLDVHGQVTILVPSNFFFSRYKWASLTADEQLQVLHTHILIGKYTLQDFVEAGNATYTPREPGLVLEKDTRQYFRVKNLVDPLAPRSFFEQNVPLNKADVFVGSRFAVHGVSLTITPPLISKGPLFSLNN